MKPTEGEKTGLPGSRVKALLNNHPSVCSLFWICRSHSFRTVHHCWRSPL